MEHTSLVDFAKAMDLAEALSDKIRQMQQLEDEINELCKWDGLELKFKVIIEQ